MVVRGHKNWVSQTDNGKASSMDSRWDMGDARDGISTGSCGNTVKNDLDRETTGNRGTVGGVATYLWSVSRRKGLRRGRKEEGGMVATRGGGEASKINLNINITGSKEEEAMKIESHTLGSRRIWRRRAGIWNAGMETDDAHVGR